VDASLAAFGSLILSAALAVASPAAIGPLPDSRQVTASREAPLERVLVAVLDDDALTETFTLDVLATRLHVADPAATPVVMVPGTPATVVGSFVVTVDPPAADDSVGMVRIAQIDAAALETDVGLAIPPPAVPTQAIVIEVIGGRSGVVAHREGLLDLTPDELRVPTWQLPARGDGAVVLDGAWWTLGPTRTASEPLAADATDRVRDRLTRDPVSRLRRLVDVSVGDVTGDGTPDVALSFRRPFRRTLLNSALPRRTWTDAAGLSAHVGLYRMTDLSEVWVAGTLVRPVRRLTACTGAIAVAYSTLRSARVIATSAWRWQGYAFLPLPELPGRGTPTCLDVDRDGRSEPAIIERS
jgi:hypothetical protein